jgi:hypothetical protein
MPRRKNNIHDKMPDTTPSEQKPNAPSERDRERKKAALQAQLEQLDAKSKRLQALPREQVAESLFRTEQAIANTKEQLKAYD